VGLGDAAPPSQLLSIRSGDAGVTDTLKLMAQLARQYKVNPAIRQLAARTVQACAPKDEMCEAATLQNWVRSNIRYTGDVYEVETVQTPDYTLQEAYGDCDDQAVLLATLLLAIGIPAAYCAVGTNGGPFSHVMAVAIVRGHTQVSYLPLETTLDQDPTTGAAIGPGWFPDNATCVRMFHI
jgi:transglutaminase-like putative cysteine protease